MIVWRETMSVGAPALDADHKKLVEVANLVERGIEQDAWPQVAAVIDQLISFGQDHFTREEAIMASLKFPETEAHRKLHQELLAKLRLLREKFAAAGTDAERKTCAQVLGKIMQGWLMDHLLKHDMKYKSFIPAKPATAAPPPESVTRTGIVHASEEEVAAERKARFESRSKDVEYALPDNLAHLLKRMEYVIPELPPPAREFDSFEKFCVAAICRRVDKVLVFFQRHNPGLQLELPTFFLASPAFARKFHLAIEKFIFPTIWESRQVRVLSTSFDWASEDTDSFWEHVTRPLEQCLQQGWNMAWDDLRLIEVRKGTQRVLQVKDSTKALREVLKPDDPGDYDMPRIVNREIEVFKSLMDPANDWSELLERSWRICNDLYEQEKDPRVFQQRAREGAFRDGLLNAFNRFPPEWVDFIVLTCHRVFPRVTTSFLERFATNLGRSEAERESYIPFTIRYLNQVRERPDIQQREQQQEIEWQATMKELSDYLANRTPKD